MKKKDFIKATYGKRNTIVSFAGHTISVTCWKPKPWELVSNNNFNITSQRSYVPLSSFKTKEELWGYLKSSTSSYTPPSDV